jgi:hypothetical protein
VDQPLQQAALQGHLLADERILWTGRPDPNRLFGRADLYLVPFSLLWGGFAIFWEAGVLGFLGNSGNSSVTFFALWGIPFVMAGQYFIWGRLIYKRWDRRRTIYAVTTQRILILRGSSVQSMFLKALPAVKQSARSNGSGTLEFGNSPNGYGYWANSGMDWLNRRAGALCFYDIPDVAGVFRTIAEAGSHSRGGGSVLGAT